MVSVWTLAAPNVEDLDRSLPELVRQSGLELAAHQFLADKISRQSQAFLPGQHAGLE